jgi:hypothetical protein
LAAWPQAHCASRGPSPIGYGRMIFIPLLRGAVLSV